MDLSDKMARIFIEAVNEEFSQVSKLYHLRGPTIIKQSPLYVEVGYIDESLSIILTLDIRDEVVDCQVRQTINGALVAYGQGRQEYLCTLLLRQGVPKEEIEVEIRKSASSVERMREMVKHCAHLLHKYGSRILTSDLWVIRVESK